MWTLDDIRLFTQKSNNTGSQAIARLQPLASGTIYHVFGWTDLTKKLSAYIVGYPDQNSLIAMMRDGETHVLSGAGILLGDYYIVNMDSEMQPTIYQNFYVDANHDCDDPVFLVNLELAKAEG